jgi:hypothetical protein
MDRKCVHIIHKPSVSDALSAVTIPLITAYAERIGAEVNIIGNTRAFPDYPATYERMQIFAAGRHYKWNICVDADVLLGPSVIDVTAAIPRNAVGLIMHYAASLSFPVDNRFFGRDGRDLVPVEAFLVTSDWTHDLWEPLRGSPAANLAEVFHEYQIAEYALALNMARYGLKCIGALPPGSQIARVIGDPKTGWNDIAVARETLRQWGVG